MNGLHLDSRYYLVQDLRALPKEINSTWNPVVGQKVGSGAWWRLGTSSFAVRVQILPILVLRIASHSTYTCWHTPVKSGAMSEHTSLISVLTDQCQMPKLAVERGESSKLNQES